MTHIGRITLGFLSLLPLTAAAAELHVAVTANFADTLEKLAPPFARATGHTLLVSSGSSGQLYTQIQQGAPVDVFLSADTERPRLLEVAGLGVKGSRITYAVGTLVLWSPKPGVVDDAGAVLKGTRFRFVSLANPRNAPYGIAAREVLTQLGIWDSLTRDDRIVLGESITQAWQFTASGNADLGFVALSQVIGADGSIAGSHWLPPPALYTRLDQDAVVLARSAEPEAAAAFMRWLRADATARAIIHADGYRDGDTR